MLICPCIYSCECWQNLVKYLCNEVAILESNQFSLCVVIYSKLYLHNIFLIFSFSLTTTLYSIVTQSSKETGKPNPHSIFMSKLIVVTLTCVVVALLCVYFCTYTNMYVSIYRSLLARGSRSSVMKWFYWLSVPDVLVFSTTSPSPVITLSSDGTGKLFHPHIYRNQLYANTVCIFIMPKFINSKSFSIYGSPH